MDVHLCKGYIINSVGGFYDVAVGNIRVRTRARGVFRDQGVKPLPGDLVTVRLSEEDRSGYIESILPRKNQLLRPPVANVDQGAIVVSVKSPKLNPWILDRMLVLLAVESIDPLIIISKQDLDGEGALYWKRIYENAGYRVFTTKVTIEYPKALKKALEGKITAFMGPSGSGKSSLINAVADHKLETGEISEKTNRGRHTTRHVELYPLDTSGYIFDTPGFTALDLGRVLEEPSQLRELFIEMKKYQGNCRFHRCLHDQEPGCAVKEAVERGEISVTRYENYANFLREIKEYRRY